MVRDSTNNSQQPKLPLKLQFLLMFILITVSIMKDVI